MEVSKILLSEYASKLPQSWKDLYTEYPIRRGLSGDLGGYHISGFKGYLDYGFEWSITNEGVNFWLPIYYGVNYHTIYKFKIT